MMVREGPDQAGPAATGAPGDRLTRVCRVAVPTTLTALAALHAAWALGWRWPGGSDQAFAEHVLSERERTRLGSGELAPAAATWAVALALLGSAATVRTVGTNTRSRALRGAAWGVSGVLLARGVVYVPSDLIGGLSDTYERLDLTIYSPLCLALGIVTAIVTRDALSPSDHDMEQA